ncbi:MAG: exo-alpha-sialidase [Methanomassiliicoccales archaeon]|nr:MAG: exo-alpha-sialidase [Methanomassiliicoccales archaeon]
MAEESGELLSGNNKLMAVIVVLILLTGTFIASLAFYESPSIRGEIFEEEFKIKIGENVAVTSVPENNNEPGIAVDPNDPLHIVAGGNDYGTPNGDAWVGYYVSWDGGETWFRDLIPGYLGGPISPLTGFDLAGDPVVCFDSDGDVFISGLMAKRDRNPINPFGFGFNLGRADGIFVAKSTDGGETFPSSQINVIVTAMQALISFHDKEWMAVDMNNGNVYVVWVVFTALSMANVLFSRSTDNGESFTTPMVISEFQVREFGGHGSTIQVTPDGTVHILWVDFDAGQVRYTYSTDEGQSFSTPESICEVIEIPRYMEGNDYRTPTLLMSAVDLSDTNTSGSLYVTWNDYRTGDADILMIYSRDGGSTWSEPIRVNNDTEGNGKDQFFSAVAVSPQGYVHLIYYDRRDDEDNTMMHIYYALSKDGGEEYTFQTNITTVSFDGNNGVGSEPFIGDYIGICATNTTAYGIWCDTREASEGSNDCELYFGSVEFACGECEGEEEE